MKITILEPHGYCSGVARAISIALKVKEEYPSTPIHILGMLVHNEAVASFLKEKGINTLTSKEKSLEELLLSVKEKEIIIFTAHGHPYQLEEIAKEKNLIVFDAVCPKVQANLSLIKSEINTGHEIIYIGYKNHPETNASLSIDKNVHLYDVNNGFASLNIQDKSPLILNQTTLNYFEIKNIHEQLKSIYPEARILNEVCPTTRLRQESLINLDKDVDAILIIGDPKSSNTTRLYEVAKSVHPHLQVEKISNINELDVSHYQKKKHVAITSGASTPDFISDQIIDLLKRI